MNTVVSNLRGALSALAENNTDYSYPYAVGVMASTMRDMARDSRFSDEERDLFRQVADALAHVGDAPKHD